MLALGVLVNVATAWTALPVHPGPQTQSGPYASYAAGTAAYSPAAGIGLAPEPYVVVAEAAAPEQPLVQPALFAALCCGVGALVGYGLAQKQQDTRALSPSAVQDLEDALERAVRPINVVAPMPTMIPSTASRQTRGAAPQKTRPVRKSLRSNVAGLKMGFDQEAFIAESKEMRLKHLEEQAMFALKTSCENFENPVFPNAMIAGDCVITHLLGRLGYLESGKCKIMVVDTFHLFDETMPFLAGIEKNYGFKAEVFGPEGVPAGDKAAYDKKYGANLWREDIEQYDKVCKVEPFQRGLKTLNTDCMINGRTRWQGFERAWIDQFENAPIGGGLAKCNPLAYWTLEDCFDYIAKYKVPVHPSTAKGYPSHGDAKDTIPVPSMDERAKVKEEGYTAFVNYEWVGDKTKWLDYARERVGRFVGLVNKDGSTKTECGIHVAGAEKTFDRDLWDKSASVQTLATEADVDALKASGKEAVVVVYAPWCQFCQAMEDEYEKLADATGMPVYKFRGDEQREFVEANLNTTSFPTINFVGADGKPIKYESEVRTVDAMAEFAKSGGKAKVSA
jgi:phosphoadenosine phosphosulfate reductase